MKSLLRFLRNWTLPVSIASGIAIYLVFALVPALDGAARVCGPICDRILPLFMFLILFVTFCKVDFRRLIPVRWMLWVGVVQVLFVALLTLLVVEYRLKGNSLIIVEAIITCIIAPVAAAAPVVTAKLGGKLEQMTTYTFISNFITALLIPVCFPLIDKAANVSFLTAFLTILHEVCMVLVLPTLRISFSWSTRSSWACRSKGMSPISSRKMVPVWANSNRPFFPPFLAPVKEPSS